MNPLKRRATAENRQEPAARGTDPQIAGRPTKARLALSEIHGNVTVTSSTLTLWFVLGQQRWSFTTDAQREQLITQYGRRLAALAGRTVHLRVTGRPYPASEWAKALHEATPAPLGGPTGDLWSDHLTETQKALRSSTLADKIVFLGIDLKRRGNRDRTKAAMRGLPGALREIEENRTTINRIADIVAGPGMQGRAATTDEIEWLVHRSVRLGLPALTRLSADGEGSWAPEDMATFTEGVDYRYKPFAPTVQVVADYNGTDIDRHVAVLTLGRMGPITIPQRATDPWMQAVDRLPFPVEWSATFKVLAGPEAAKETGRKRLAIRDQQKHYREHGLEEPLDLARKAEHARRIEDETTEGDPVTAARCHGWFRLAVSGVDEEECLRRVQEVKDAYQTQQITVNHPRSVVDAASQLSLLREFIPGEPLASESYKRRLPALYTAAALPHVSASVGDRRGPYMGYTAGTSRRAFTFDPHYAMEVAESSGLVPIVGGLGSGKSGLLGKLVYESTLRNITTTVLDPSGPLAAITRMERIAPHARHIDLVRGQEGILSPYSVITDPVRENYADEMEYREALVHATQNRKVLALDVARALLPPQVDELPASRLVLSDAIRFVGGDPTKSLWDVVKVLRDRNDEHHAAARDVANYLQDMAELPQSRLFFPNTVRDQSALTDTLLVLTMQGIQLPDINQPRTSWSTQEQLSVPLLHLASHFATSRSYGLSRDERKMVALDEAGMVGQWGSGRTLFTRLSVDTRKWNIAAMVASQDPAHITALNVANYISAAFVGRIEDDEIAAEALRLLRIKTGVGYEPVLAGLSPQVATANGHRKRGAREFIVKDVDGNVEKVRVDMSHQPELLAALNTTADPTRGRDRVEEGAVA